MYVSLPPPPGLRGGGVEHLVRAGGRLPDFVDGIDRLHPLDHLRRPPHGNIHRAGPEFGPTLKTIIGIFSETTGPACEFWANPVNFSLAVASAFARTADREGGAGRAVRACMRHGIARPARPTGDEVAARGCVSSPEMVGNGDSIP
jgi:hypothetical protein